jgi:hypothetical protein
MFVVYWVKVVDVACKSLHRFSTCKIWFSRNLLGVTIGKFYLTWEPLWGSQQPEFRMDKGLNPKVVASRLMRGFSLS